MFKDDKQGVEKSKNIAERLGKFENHKTHGHPISIKGAVSKGLKVKPFERVRKLQDKILSIFHAAMATFAVAACIKIIESHNG